MALLDILAKMAQKRGLELTVAHFNHGIRADSDKDEALVSHIAKKYNLPFEAGYGHLGPKTSEAKARQARYSFLSKIRQRHQAKAIITAHHQDDLIETAFLNILRGTSWRGLSSIKDQQDLLRPLLKYSKQQIVDYASKNKLSWREDTTNLDTSYLRNYLRRQILPSLAAIERAKLISKIDKVAEIKPELDSLIATMSHDISFGNQINRRTFTNLPTDLGDELLADWLRRQNIKQFDKPIIHRLSTVIKTGLAGSKHDIKRGYQLILTADSAQLAKKT